MAEDTMHATFAEVSAPVIEDRRSCGMKMPTIDDIADILDDAGIDYIPLLDEGRLYITAFAFNIWVRVHPQSTAIFLTTNWDLDAEADELELLRHVNRLNAGLPLVQFAWDEDESRLYGHAWLSARGGIAPAVLIRTAIRFADIFKEAHDMTCAVGFAVTEASVGTIN